MNIYELSNYTLDIDNIISQYIREYDIQKANINILYKYNKIDNDLYNELINSDRMTRQIKIGLLIRDNPSLGKTLEKGLCEARRLFIESNNIEDDEILSIKKDAIFLINKIPKITEFGNIKFVNKNIYTSFYKLEKHTHAFYYLDKFNGTEILDIKGISDDILPIHENHFIEFLKVVFESAQTESPVETLDIIINFYKQYIELKLDKEYYREFNAGSKFRFKSNFSQITTYTSDYLLNDSNKPYLDISYNMEIIRNLFQYFTRIISRQIR